MPPRTTAPKIAGLSQAQQAALNEAWAKANPAQRDQFLRMLPGLDADGVIRTAYSVLTPESTATPPAASRDPFTDALVRKSGAQAKATETAKADEQRRKQQDQAKQDLATQQVNDANTTYAWVDGKRVRIIGFDQKTGAPLYTLDGHGDPNKKDTKGNPAPFQYAPPTAYDALDNTDVPDPDYQFTFSHGPQFDPTTNATKSVLNVPAAPVHLGGSLLDKERAQQAAGIGLYPFDNPVQAQQAQRRVNDMTGENRMTIGGAVQWLVALSIKDPAAYAAMVDKLHDAGYLNDSDYATAGGGWSSQVGAALAIAGRDVAVINGQPGGENVDLPGYLDQRAAAAKDAAAKLRASQYQPVTRQYTDPDALKASARDAALQTLGRQLTPAEEAALTGHFHSLEAAMYDGIDAAGRAGNNATYTQPNATGQVDAFLHSGDLAQEAKQWDVAGYGAMMRNLFGLPG